MWIMKLKLTALVVFCVCYAKGQTRKSTEKEAREYLAQLEPRYSAACNKMQNANWAYSTNITYETSEASAKAQAEFAAFTSEIQREILSNYSNYNEFSDNQLRREFKYLAFSGPGKMSLENVNKMNRLLKEMDASYATATVCDYKEPKKCDIRFFPEIAGKLAKSRDWDELAHYWTSWHDTMSNAVSGQQYSQLVKYQMELARANGFRGITEMWLNSYDDETPEWNPKQFQEEIFGIWAELRPFFDKFAAYVRMKLRALPEYANKIAKFDNIPAHLLGNMWAQEWTNIDNFTKPFPAAPSLDPTAAMLRANYTPRRLYVESEKFYSSLGLLPMPKKFWELSMLERPSDGRDVDCYPSAFDLCLGKESTDFRIKQCATVDMYNLVTVHHEMGHIQYDMQYTNLHYIFRDGANPGFQEALGDSMALAVLTPHHLECVLKLQLGLNLDCNKNIKANNFDGKVTENDINFLYLTALKKLVYFPFAISLESWRWEVFEGKINEANYNARWWQLRRENQRINTPSDRSHPGLFDPAAKYHIVSNTPYIRYFVAYILQFQFYESMCKAAGEYDPTSSRSKPLYQCDFDGSLEAGNLISKMMRLGFSQPWPVALESITGSKKMSIAPFLNYFAPLFDYIDKELKAYGEIACFGDEIKCGNIHPQTNKVKRSIEEEEEDQKEKQMIMSQFPCEDGEDVFRCEKLATEYLNGRHNRLSTAWSRKASLAGWEHSTDLMNKEALENEEKIGLEAVKWGKEETADIISRFPWKKFSNKSLKRTFKALTELGVAVLPEDEIEKFTSITSEMGKIFSTGKICPYKNQKCNLQNEGLPMDPDLSYILAHSRDYEELKYVWWAWRNATGKQMRGLYSKFIDISNKIAKGNGYSSAAESWISSYESETFRDDLAELWKELKPLYEELHAYVRHKLGIVYPGKVTDGKAIPACILGNMWSQRWETIYELVEPFPNAVSFDITPELRKRFPNTKEGVREMFKIANKFFLSLGFEDMSQAFGDKSQIIRPNNGKEVVCHASASDFSDGKDYRITMCADITQIDFLTIHHELGHVQYYMQYRNLPAVDRNGANSGFHEAVGDVVSLSVASPTHLRSLGLINTSSNAEGSQGAEINFLLMKALEKVAALPFTYLIDNYRWGLFDDSIPRSEITKHWLRLRNELQGIVPPVKRSEEDFDAGAKYHVAEVVPYIRYFVSFILQFQIHKELCDAAGHNGHLYLCDIQGNKKAGMKFKKLMQTGSSKKWEEVLSDLTDGKASKLDAGPIKEYFQPLTDYLKELRNKLKYSIGWDNEEYLKFYSS